MIINNNDVTMVIIFDSTNQNSNWNYANVNILIVSNRLFCIINNFNVIGLMFIDV
jgi:hypothetical protein